MPIHTPLCAALAISAIFAMMPAQAQQVFYTNEPNDGWFSPYLSYEANELGQITTFGGLFQSDSFFQLSVGLATYQSDTQSGNHAYQSQFDFVNLDTAVRFGTFDKVSLYGEVGLALDEVFFDEEEDEYYDSWGGRTERMGPIDWFAGVGAGVELNNLSLKAFGRFRYLRSYEQEYLAMNYPGRTPDDTQWFTGVELSLRF